MITLTRQQLPFFVVGSIALWRGDKRIWPLTLLYAASSATTTLACITTILATPAVDHVGLMLAVRLIALRPADGQYAPFLLIALVIMVECVGQCSALLIGAAWLRA